MKKRIDIERVRELAFQRACGDEPLPFYEVALELGAYEAEAEAIDEALTERLMRARGAI